MNRPETVTDLACLLEGLLCDRMRKFSGSALLATLALGWALPSAAQSLERLASSFREKPTPAHRAALLNYAAAHPKDASGALALLSVGVTEAESKNTAEAIRRLRSARPRLPQIADYVSFHLGTAYLDSKQYPEALGELRAVLERSPA